MPSKTLKQRNFMAAAAHNPTFAKKVGISQKVAKEFNQADKGKKFRGGGMAKRKKYEEGGEVDGGLTFAEMSDEDRAALAKARMSEMGGPMPEEPETKRAVTKVKAAGVKTPEARSEARTMSKINAITGPEPAKSRAAAMPDVAARKAQTEQRTRRSAFGGENKGVYGMKAGGKVRGCGIAQRGKTKGRMV